MSTRTPDLPAPGATLASRPRVGCDVQSVASVARAVDHFGARYLDRVYTPGEQHDHLVGGAGGPARLAARFAAKEAVLKLIGEPDGVDLREIEVIGGGGRPHVRLSGHAALLATQAGLGPIDLSLSHDGDAAFAVAVALTHPPQGEPA